MNGSAIAGYLDAEGPRDLTHAERRAIVTSTIGATAPLVPYWVVALVAGMIDNPAFRADALLIFADAVAEAAGVARVEGRVTLAAQLDHLADLPRDLARHRPETCPCP